MRGTSASSRTSCSGSTTTATSTRTSTRAGTASAARRSRRRPSSSTASAPIHGTEPEWLEEKNWFFRLSAYQDRLLQLYDERPDFVLPHFRYNEARSFIAGGLRDFSISRATQTWGVPIPWDPDQVAYVWADALVNYRSALSYAPGENLERFWPAVHLLAKDILRFHCVYWPALLLSAGEEPPKQLFVHGYLNFDNRKMSKSLGNVIDPLELVDVYGADAVRFYAARVTTLRPGRQRLGRRRARALRARARERPRQPRLAHDGDDRPLSRRRTRADRAPTPPWDADVLREQARRRARRYDITGALEEIWLAVRRLNQYVEESAPWQLAKDDARSDELDAVLYNLADGLTAIAVAVSPYLPESAPRILEALGQPSDDLSLERIRARHGRRGRRDRGFAAALPAHRAAGRRRRDRHPRASRRVRGSGGRARRARARGGRRRASSRSARRSRRGARRSRSPSVTTASSRRSASTRTRPPTATSPRCATRSQHPKAVAVGETGPRLLPRLRAARRAAARLRRAARSSPRSSTSRSSSTRARPTRTRSHALEGFAGTVVLHCFSSLPLLEPALERGWYVSFAGNVTYKNAHDLRSAAYAVPAERLLAETDSPYLTPVPRRGRPNEPANVVHTVAALARARNADRGRARCADRGERLALLRAVSTARRRSSASTSSSTRTSCA